MPGRRKPVRNQRAYDPFAPLTSEDQKRFAGKWVVVFEGKVRGVGNSFKMAMRRARLPEGAEPELVTRIPGVERWY